MIWRLTYCNGSGDTARLDIQQGGATPIMEIEGTGNPFTLSFNGDKKDKTLNFLTTSADIQIYETENFNIDKLKTSSETELSVKYYINDTLYWAGFVIPDFFSKEIKENSIVSMVASDRIGALKGVTLTDLPSKLTIRELASLCLAKTGLSLPLKTMADFSNGTNNNDFFRAEVLTQRLTDNKGRSISCYDILQSILNQSNSVLVQRKGEWYIVNKMQLEVGSGKLYSTETTQSAYVEQIVNFASVEVGAMRTIEPVGASIGVYHEHGGGRLHPDDYDFAQGGSGWVSKNGFSYTISNQKPVSYSVGVPNHTVTFGESDRNRMMVMGIVYPFWRPDTAPHVENKFPVITSNENSVKITIDISVLGWGLSGSGSTGRFIILAENGDNRLAFNPSSGHFEDFDNQATAPNSSEPPYVIKLKPSANKVGDIYPVTNKSVKYETVLEKDNLSDYTISIRIYGTSGFSGPTAPLFINFANVRFSNTEEAPRGTIFKTIQGSNFTKEHEVRTVLWGDYINSGLNGYFYNYPIDDTSSLYNGAELTSLWSTPFDTDMLPLLQHVSRQRSRLFSIAHDLINIATKVNVFDPLSILKDCNGNRYVTVSAEFDFLRSKVYVTAEQSLFDNTILKRDFIYSYFGEGESNIKSIGGIAGGGGGTGGGGGMTSEQLEMLTNLADWWKLDEENDAIYSEKSVYSLKGVSALGLGSEGGGGGGDFSRLDAWADYTAPKAGWVLSALLGYDLHTRVNSLEAGAGSSNIGVVVTGAGNAITGVSLSGNTLTFAKGSTFALSTHNHAIANVTGLQDALDGKEPFFTKNTAFNKNFGTTAGTVAQGNDSRIINGQTAYNWGNHSSAGYALNSSLTTHTGNTTVHITATERTNWNDANSKKHTHSNKALLDQITQSNIDVLAKLSIVDGNIKVDTTLWATGGISALGLGDGGGSGGSGVDMLDSWANYTTAKANYYAPASLLVPFRNDTLSRLSSLESGSATSITTTGSGNAITSLTKSGSVITANKGLTFALASHTHTFESLTNKPTTISGYDITDSFRELRRVTDLDAVTISGIYRQESPSSGFIFTTTLNLSSSDGRQQLTISRNGSGMKFRGVNSGSGTTGWTSWKEVYHTGNLTSLSQLTDNIGVASHIANKANPHSVTKAQVGLGNVDNTSDANKPVSTATQTALNLKLNKSIFDDLFEKVEVSTGVYAIKAKYDFYSIGGVSAYGLGSGGSGGGIDISKLQSWAGYTSAMADYYVPASLLVPFRNDTLDRLNAIEGGSATSIVTTGTGNAITSLTKSGTVITANKGLTFALATHNHDTVYKPIGYAPTWGEVTGKPTTFAPSAHTHTIANVAGLQTALDGKEPSFTKNTAFNKNFGTVSGTVAEGNHTHNYLPLDTGRPEADLDTLHTSGIRGGGGTTTNRPAGSHGYSPYMVMQSATDRFVQLWFDSYGGNNIYYRNGTNSVWGNWVSLHHTGNLTSLSQLTDNIGVGSHIANATVHITATERTNWNDANSKKHTHANKSVIDALTQGHINVLNKLSLDAQGNVKVDATLWATGGISALGLGEGGGSGGGGVDILDSWANYTAVKANYYVPASLLVPFRNDTLDRLNAIEGGSATSVNVTGTGDVIVGGSKSGNVITLTRGNQSWTNLTGKPTTFAPSAHSHNASDINAGTLALARIPTGTSGTTVALGNHLHTGVYEPAFTKNTAFNKNFGTVAGTVAQGNHTHDDRYKMGYRDSGIDVDANRKENTYLSAHSWINTPITGIGILETSNQYSNDWIAQEFTKIEQQPRKFIRSFYNGTTWGDWFEFWHSGNLSSLSQLTDNIGVAAHIANKANPHAVTKAQVGLSNVDNTSDLLKPISNAVQTALNLKANLASPTFTGNVTAPTFTGALTGNSSSATKLQAARTIAGVSFDGTANIAIPFANLASKPTTLAGYGITDGALKSLTLTAGNGLTGGGTLEASRAFALGLPSTLNNSTTNEVTATSHTHAITTTTVGASNTIVATDASGGVRGNIIRIGGNWTLELSGTELVFKYQNVIKQRMLSDGTILATGGITALATN